MRVRLSFILLALTLIAAPLSAEKLTTLAANTSADSVCALLNSGFLDIYDGTEPATADTAITSQTKLAGLTFGATACAASSGGTATFNAIGSDTNAAASGTAAWARLYKSDHTTAVLDISVSTSGADLNLGTTSIVIHGTVSVVGLTYTQNK